MKRKVIRLLLYSVAVSAFLISPVIAQEVDETVGITQGDKEASLYVKKVMSEMASKVMLSIASARGDIYNKDIKSAKKALQVAIKDIDTIDTIRPIKKVLNHIRVAQKHLEYESVEEMGQDFIPISYSIEELTDLMPTDKVKDHLNRAKKAIASGNKDKAEEELKIVESIISKSTLYLPVDETKDYVVSALKYLDKNQLKDVDKVLKKAEDNLVVISIIGAGPIEKAKQDFYRAIVNYSRGNYTKTKKSLNRAELWLASISDSADKKVKSEAKMLESKTRILKKELFESTSYTTTRLKALLSDAKELKQKIFVNYKESGGKQDFYNKAIINYSQGKYIKVKDNLHQAELWLDKISNSTDKKIRSEAEELKSKTIALKREIVEISSSTTARLKKLWSDSKALSQKHIDSSISIFDSVKSNIGTKTSLLDARLHLDFARTKQFIYGTEQDTKGELNRVLDSLKRARYNADNEIKKNIQKIEKKVDILKGETGKKGVSEKVKYEQVRKDLEKLIKAL